MFVLQTRGEEGLWLVFRCRLRMGRGAAHKCNREVQKSISNLIRFSKKMANAASKAVRPIWYAVRTFNCKEMAFSNHLVEKGVECFVPMTYKAKQGKDGEKPRKVLVPIIHNYVFVKPGALSDEALTGILEELRDPYYILRNKQSKKFYEISETEMNEFRLLCDPNFENSIFMTSEEAEAKPGKEVRIVQGAFKGLTGKLHRVKNQFYFVKTMGDLGVMLRISRWYCKVID